MSDLQAANPDSIPSPTNLSRSRLDLRAAAP